MEFEAATHEAEQDESWASLPEKVDGALIYYGEICEEKFSHLLIIS